MRKTKRALSLVLAAMMIISMLVVGAVSASALDITTGSPISTSADFNAAKLAGGEYYLTNDINVAGSTDYVKSGFTLHGNGFTIKRTVQGFAPILNMEKSGSVTIDNVTFDLNGLPGSAIFAQSTSTSGTVTIDNVDVKGWYTSSGTGALTIAGHTSLVATNCNINSGGSPDVWFGGAGTASFDNASFGSVYLNGGSASATVSNGSSIGEFSFVPKANQVIATVDDTSSITSVKPSGSMVEGNVVFEAEPASAPIGYKTVVVNVGGTDYYSYELDDTQDVFIKNEADLARAAENGGTWYVQNNFSVNNMILVNAAELTIYGNGYTVTSYYSEPTVQGQNAHGAMLQMNRDDCALTIENLIIKGDWDSASTVAINTYRSNSNAGNILTLRNCTVRDFHGYSYFGAVKLFSHSTGIFENCKFQFNSIDNPHPSYPNANGADIWAGGATSVTIDGGQFTTSIYANGAAAQNTIKGGASVTLLNVEVADNIRINVLDGTVKNIAVEGGDTLNANEVVFQSGATLTNVPKGHIVIDNADGTRTIAPDPNPLNGVYGKKSGENDPVKASSVLLNGQTLGYQKKTANNYITHQEGDGVSPDGNDITTQGLRIITFVKTELLKGNDIEDYGYVVAKYTGNKYISTIDFSNLTVDGGNGQKVISCKGSSNGISNDYGNYDADTPYKYVTLALNGMSSGNKAVARFYVKKTDGTVYYAKYSSYNGVLASFS